MKKIKKYSILQFTKVTTLRNLKVIIEIQGTEKNGLSDFFVLFYDGFFTTHYEIIKSELNLRTLANVPFRRILLRSEIQRNMFNYDRVGRLNRPLIWIYSHGLRLISIHTVNLRL